LYEGHGEVHPIVNAIGLGLGQPLGDRETFEIGLARLVALSEGGVEIAEFAVGVGEVALVVGAIGLRLGQALGDREIFEVGLARLVALSEGVVEGDLRRDSRRSNPSRIRCHAQLLHLAPRRCS